MYKIKVYLVCSAVLLCGFLFGGLLYTAFSENEAVSVMSEGARNETVIIIDPGHGGEDSGAVDNGILEKDINLSIALKLRDMLTVCGYKVVMTRDTDISIYDSSASTTREKKVSDLKKRVEIINSSKDNILVSIHQNKFEQSQYSGTQMFYSQNSPGSIKLAEEMRRSVTGFLQPENKRELKPSDNSIYILSHAQVPAVIAECGFLSNKEEAQKLADDKYQQQLAFSLMCGIVSYCSQNTIDSKG